MYRNNMESFDIILSIPAALLANFIYRLLLLWFSKVYPLAVPVVIFASRCVLIAILLEWAALATWSAVELHPQLEQTTKRNRSALVRDALREHLAKLELRALEDRDRAGYLALPKSPEESALWESEAVWPER